MGRKKHQPEPNQNSDESTESCDENQNCTKCPHLNKGIDLQKVKKGLQKTGFRKDCEECIKNPVVNGFDIPSDIDIEFDNSLWLCLKCGNQACGRSANKHALKHFKTPRSDSHTLCLNTSTWWVWCYDCDNEVNTTASKKLLETVEYLKKSCEQEKIKSETSTRNMEDKPMDLIESHMPLNLASGCLAHFKRTVGLRNLGNTCFFNAVIQNLSHTPYLLELLSETSEDLQAFRLPGGKLIVDENKSIELEPLEGTLEQWGLLAKVLAETMKTLQNGESDVFSPQTLLMRLTQRMPQFVIGEQHDSHELLRHLLEAVREEDSKRYQSVILSKLGFSKKTNPAHVEQDKKLICKFYGQQASELLSPTEQVFRGTLVSTLQCEDCSHTSHREEYFLDLSLPITEKPIPPMLRRKADEIEEKSKHQVKKERRAAKKNKKHKGMKSGNSSKQADLDGSLDNDNNSGSESDADVEDNIEDNKVALEVDIEKPQKGSESGYNSDKTSETSPGPPALQFLDTVSAELLSSSPLDTIDNNSSSSEIEMKFSNSPANTTASPKDEKTVEFERPESRLSFVNAKNGDLKEDLEKLSLLNDGDSQKVGAIFSREMYDEACSNDIIEDADERMEEDEDPDMWMGTMCPRYQCEEGECSVQSCLNQFTACELMTSNNKVSCENCTKRYGGSEKKIVYTNALKQLLIYNPPAVLILHLKRFQVYHFRPTKVSKHVSFPVLLDIAPFISKRSQSLPTFEAGQSKVLYSLFGVVEHSGSMHGGHYVAYVKVRPKLEANNYRWQFLPRNQKQKKGSDENPGAHGIPDVPPGKWYYVSDSYVSEVQESKVLNAQAYLLFYERIY